MITHVVSGSGRNRKSVDLPAEAPKRKIVANVLKQVLFPTQAAHDAAMAQGTVNRTAYQAQQRSNRT